MGMMQNIVYQTPVRDVTDLKRRLIDTCMYVEIFMFVQQLTA